MILHCFGNSHLFALFGHASNGSSDELMTLDAQTGGPNLRGWKLGSSGATAYGLMKANSRTGAGDSIIRILNEEQGMKDVLLVFGEVDVSVHIGNHGLDEDDDVRRVVARYVEFVTMLMDRPDIGRVLVTSMIPHHAGLNEFHRILRITMKWNQAIRSAVELAGLTYVDWFDCIANDDGSVLSGLCHNDLDNGELHLSKTAQSILYDAVKTALLR